MPTPNPRRICSYCKFHNHDDGPDGQVVTCRVNPPAVVPTAAAYNSRDGGHEEFRHRVAGRE